MTPKERELLRAACNCYNACKENFEETVRMISEARGLDPNEVKELLTSLKVKYRDDPEYIELRSRLPSDFPV
ncbi:hypothetical protein [Sulfodiicoccus acidiphilus]|nr:hypothetical protein [Sulfodiicoccus acidiphilus]